MGSLWTGLKMLLWKSDKDVAVEELRSCYCGGSMEMSLLLWRSDEDVIVVYQKVSLQAVN